MQSQLSDRVFNLKYNTNGWLSVYRVVTLDGHSGGLHLE
jgi:hypothetical protein